MKLSHAMSKAFVTLGVSLKREDDGISQLRSAVEDAACSVATGIQEYIDGLIGSNDKETATLRIDARSTFSRGQSDSIATQYGVEYVVGAPNKNGGVPCIFKTDTPEGAAAQKAQSRAYALVTEYFTAQGIDPAPYRFVQGAGGRPASTLTPAEKKAKERARDRARKAKAKKEAKENASSPDRISSKATSKQLVAFLRKYGATDKQIAKLAMDIEGLV